MWRGGLRTLEVADIGQPLSDVRAYLVANYEARKDVHPKVFEDVVGSVFGDFNYSALVTAYAKDGGLDVVLTGADGHTIGVQVKRTRRTISVEQIRAFTGALVDAGTLRGLYVTTSNFSNEARSLATRLKSKGYRIELLDAHRFLAALKVAQLSSFDPSARPYSGREKEFTRSLWW
jgi:restriction endonuclease Mrr